jgi:hypothetical protein
MAKCCNAVRNIVVLICGFAILAFAAWAQVSNAVINGTVRDTTGAVIPQTSVVLRNTQTGVETRTSTNDQGIYILLNILPGTYVLEASREGFTTSRLQPFALVVNQASVFDFRLAVGEMQSSVTVEATGTQVQSATAELGAVLTSREVLDLPFSSVQGLMMLAPGVNGVSTGQSSIPSVNGQINRSSLFLLDGVNNHSTFYSEMMVGPILDTLDEFKVQSHNDSAEMGGVLGALVNATTKSGTNELHGDVWYKAQNEAFNARNTFEPSVNPYKLHDFGGTAGGPVILPGLYNGKNRTFFFAGYEFSHSGSPARNYMRVPTEANYNGNFSDWAPQIYNPFTTREDPSNPGSYIRDPFPDNQIPTSLMDQGMVYLARTVLPSPEYTGVGDYNAINRQPNTGLSQTVSVRGDHRFSDFDNLSVRYTGNYSHNNYASRVPSEDGIGTNRAHNVAATWVHTFGPTSVLQASFGRGLNYGDSANKYSSLPSDFVSKVGYSANQMTQYANGSTMIPNLYASGWFSTGESYSYSQTGDNWQGKVAFSKLHGAHMFKMGAEYNTAGWKYVSAQSTTGYVNTQTADPTNLGSTGSALASFFLDVPDSAGRRDIMETTDPWAGVLGFYFQDSWKATNKLTINLGLRYDRTFIPPAGTGFRGNDIVGNMDLIKGVYVLQKMAPTCAEAKAPPCIPTPDGAAAGWLPEHVGVSTEGRIVHSTTKNFQPRIGLAYRLSSKTAIRASGGVYFDSYSGITQLSRNFAGTWPSLGWQSVPNLNYPSSTHVTPYISGKNPLPSAVLPDFDPLSQSGYWVDPDWENSYSLQWNIGVQHQVTPDLLASVNYVGSGSHRLTIGGTYNVATTPGPGNWQDRAPFPYIAVPASFDRSWGNSNYHALQTSLQRRFANGLAFTAAYTWSKSIDDAAAGFFGVEGVSLQNPYNPSADRSVSSFDIPHNLALSLVWEMPFGKGRLRTGSRVVNAAISGWQANAICGLQSGIPVNVTIWGDIANTGNYGYMRPNVAGDWHVDSPSIERWFNTAAFASPAAYTFGNAGRNILRSDASKTLNMSLFRKIQLRERVAFQIRAEASNALNSVTYGAPDAEYTDSTFGQVLSAAPARSIVLGAKIIF